MMMQPSLMMFGWFFEWVRKLGDDQAADIRYLLKGLDLRQGVLTDRAIKNNDRFMWRAVIQLTYHPHNL